MAVIEPGSRQTNRTFPTPRVQDALFFELKEIARVCPPGTTPPTYGTVHPNTTLYPSHTLCFIENADAQGLWQKWWYCASRASQETYNAEFTYPFGGNTQYARLTRKYILPRADARVGIALGTADPGGALATVQVMRTDGTELFRTDGTTTIFRTGTQTPILVAQSMREIGGEIGSLYCEVTRVFDVVPGADDSTAGSGAAQTTTGYKVTRPLGTASFLRLTWSLVLPRATADGNLSAPGNTCPIAGFGSLVLIQEVVTASDDNNQESTLTRIYEGNATGTAFPSTDTVTYHGRFYPGTMPPEKFIVSMRKVEDMTQTAASSAESDGDPWGASSPSQALAIAGGSENGLEKVEIKPDGDAPVNRSTKSVTYYTDLVLRTLTGSKWDDNMRDTVSHTTRVITIKEAEAIGAPDIGTERTMTPYNSRWVIVTVEAPTEASTSGASKTYLTTMPFSWPQVLTSIYGGFLGRKHPAGGEILAGYTEFFYDYTMKRAWTGICKAQVIVSWTKLPPAFSAVKALDPQAISVVWPGMKISIPPSLHAAIGNGSAGSPITYGTTNDVLYYTTGTEHPNYGYLGFSKSIPATAQTDWPDSIVADDDIKPYKGGFLRSIVSVFKPY